MSVQGISYTTKQGKKKHFFCKFLTFFVNFKILVNKNNVKWL